MFKYILFITTVLIILDSYLINAKRFEILNNVRKECRLGIGVDPCMERMNIGKKKGKENFFMSDSPDQENTNQSWKLISRKGYFGQTGSNVQINVKSKEKKIFQIKSFTFGVKNCKEVIIKALIEVKEETIYVFEQREPVADTDVFTDIKSYKTNATMIKLLFIHSHKNKKINIKKFFLNTCRQTAAVNPKHFKIGTDTQVTPKCAERLTNKIHAYFEVYDNDGDRDEKMALNHTEGALPYLGAPGMDVEFNLAAYDGGDFEWTSVCLTIRLACAVQYTLDADYVTYSETDFPCNSTIETKMCYNPRGIIVKKAWIRIKACPDSQDAIEVSRMTLIGCRDHWRHKYILHTNAGDSRILTIKTIRNETITKYGNKACGEMVKSEMLNYKVEDPHVDFMVFFGENSLVDKIITSEDTIKFHWRLQKPEVVISIISCKGKYQADTRVDLSDKVLHENLKSGLRKKRSRRKRRQVCPEQEIRMNIFVKQCQAFVPNALVFANIIPQGKENPIRVYGGSSRNYGMYDVILPKRAALRGTRKKLCDNILKVHQEECKRHSVITRARYNLICAELINMIWNFTEVASDDPMVERISRVCIGAFRAVMYICQAVVESPRPGMPTFFQAGCNSDNNFVEEDLYKELGQNVTASFFARSQNGDIVPGKTKMLILDKIKYFSTNLLMKDISTDVFSIPISPVIQQGYKISVHYNCGAKGRNISIALSSAALGRYEVYTHCTGPEADECSCCDFLVPGANELASLSDKEVFIDNLKILILQKGRRVFERSYFIQVHGLN